ncbi:MULTISPECIES: ABC transporter substrate-binding protein [unclassified Nocardioides]|uniref:ABC transporter substrate-binding protein n=1 Tax=unclassified Nocardioides TaxID=2615069 RepID=UPI0009F07470|nr:MULTISPECIES: ABC transporter substrate-binding protein [unclassified Nocardioides]GAW48583.1 spermidine/putrescine ABC transporter substrate-binding protein [Nocardioides sp. PD653-B2]GAW54318.1 spermidine/putrescine ABC transporter substrate-binding protein [Nocardioides sp. PD653]
MKTIGSKRLAAVACAGLLALATACGTSSGDGDGGGPKAAEEQGGFTAPDVPMMEELGDMEGEVNILAWPGYAEDGSTDKSIDWVTPFEEKTGCQANVKYFATSDEAIQLMKSGEYDVVSASGDASLRLIAGGDAAPVNTDLLTNYPDIEDFLKDQPWNSVDGQMYGVPHGWGANLLMYNPDVVDPAPTGWSAVFDDASQYAGKVTAYDSPIYIADAALYLMNTQPDLGIKDPYALDEDQLAAAVDLLKKQKANVSEYWSDYLKEVAAFKSGDSVIGTTWQVIASTIGDKVEAFLPDEGSTGWSDTWMISADAPDPNCGYAWMDYITSPEAQAAVAEYFGEAPANTLACDLTSDTSFCDTYHAKDAAYADQIHYWTTPIAQCLDGRTDVTCTDYGDWTTAWTEVKG